VSLTVGQTNQEALVRRALETIVIGAGQAGLSVSYYLKAARRDHVVFEKYERQNLSA